ncbi:hypothetical protein [Carnobacterium maltaromaticum]|uniref:hypothetical protein n=1 Tax=Carnobacterium maltaromaticum TaxID=2751 RepID=UPI0039BEBC68
MSSIIIVSGLFSFYLSIKQKENKIGGFIYSSIILLSGVGLLYVYVLYGGIAPQTYLLMGV